VAAARRYGKKFGIPDNVLEGRVMTLDRYLMHIKAKAALVRIDEFSMVHAGKIDAVVSLARAHDVHLYGDGRQIPYDPFCSEFNMRYAKFGRTIPSENIEFIGKSHRCMEDTCAMWLDQYPFFYPCDCCNVGMKERTSMQVVRIRSVADIPFESDARYHAYKQEEKDELRIGLNMRGDAQSLRAKENSGLATVHEDQGSTHEKVRTARLNVIYDKNASARNPSLYNRVNYVLTDTTRHTKDYVYYTMCEEDDVVVQRVRLSGNAELRAAVRRKEGLGKVTIESLLD